MREPLLHLSDVGFVIERIGRCGCAQRMRADLKTEPHGIPADQLVDSVRRNGVVASVGAVVADGTEEGTLGIGRMTRLIEVVIRSALPGRHYLRVAEVVCRLASGIATAVSPRIDARSPSSRKI
jgi:hypothetical protein